MLPCGYVDYSLAVGPSGFLLDNPAHLMNELTPWPSVRGGGARTNHSASLSWAKPCRID
jgi:hypothetical protein